jgi:hypothetical protein
LGVVCKLVATNPPEIIERPNRQATALPENQVGRVILTAPFRSEVQPSNPGALGGVWEINLPEFPLVRV